MEFDTLKVPGTNAVRLLNEHRSQYRFTGMYPFLIGEAAELVRIEKTAEFNEQTPAAIIEASSTRSIAEWVSAERIAAEEYDFSEQEILGVWQNKVHGEGAITIHKEFSGRIKPEVYLGLAKINKPWQLPAVLRYGNWNCCPPPEVHCAYYREWQNRFGVEILGISGDVIECTVKDPPSTSEASIALAWQQYWYCPDIVVQGCESICNLATTLMNSHYWYFWWD